MTRRPNPPARRQLLRTREQPRRFEHARALAVAERHTDEDTLRQALIDENATLARELGRIQQRCTAWRDASGAQTERLEAALMRARAQAIVKDTQIAALRDALDALHKRAAVWLTNEELVRRMSDLRARNRSLEDELLQSRRAVAVPSSAKDASRPPATDGSPRPGSPRILCVGGRSRQIPVYRELVERRGGRFSHAPGIDDDGDLDRLLDAADVVILQAGYVCRSACRAVESHCARTGKPCLWLAKPCAQAFAHSLRDVCTAARAGVK